MTKQKTLKSELFKIREERDALQARLTETLEECHGRVAELSGERDCIEAALPKTYYSDLPLEKRVRFMTGAWNRAVVLVQKLQESLDAECDRLAVAQARIAEIELALKRAIRALEFASTPEARVVHYLDLVAELRPALSGSSGWLADHDREITAKALEDAAQGWSAETYPSCEWYAGGVTQWFRERAERILAGEKDGEVASPPPVPEAKP